MSGEWRSCGNVLSDGALNGLCSVCLLRKGLAGHSASSGDTAPAMSLTVAPGVSALVTLYRSLGGLPRVMLRDSELGDGHRRWSSRVRRRCPQRGMALAGCSSWARSPAGGWVQS